MASGITTAWILRALGLVDTVGIDKRHLVERVGLVLDHKTVEIDAS
jgi:hypothetical protein